MASPTPTNPPAFLGIDATQPVVIGPPRRRIYLDAAATCLMPTQVWDTVGKYLAAACSNPHSHASAGSRATTAAMNRTHRLVCNFFGASAQDHAVILTGSGATEAANTLASAVFSAAGHRNIAIVSSQEHHSNLLPWMRACGAINGQVAYIATLADGSLDLNHLQTLLNQYGPYVRVVAVTALSNVTGVINPVQVIADMAHSVGAEIVVDAAQAAAHFPINMTRLGIDHLVASGHKMYAPGSPGILICRRGLMKNYVGQVGGGMVDRVELGRVWYKTDVSERQEAGTPNVPGTVALGAAIRMLQGTSGGMDGVRKHELEILTALVRGLGTVPGLRMYGPAAADVKMRGGLVSFNLEIPHGLVAAALNDFFAIAVRNDCFCAQPYVRQQLESACDIDGYCAPVAPGMKKGMVRASVGLWTTAEDIDKLVTALKWIVANRGYLEQNYRGAPDGDYWVHKTWSGKPAFEL